MTRFRLTTFLALMTLAAGAVAGGAWPEAGAAVEGQRDARGWPVVPDLSLVGRGEIVPTVEIGRFPALEGESVDDTVARVAEVARAFTLEKGFEACALVCMNAQGQAGLVLTTNFSQVGCATRRDEQALCPVGFAAVEGAETLHTHPEVSSVHANPVDAIFAGTRRGRLLRILPEHFSDGDLANGPGYLVAQGRLLHNAGDGQVRELDSVLAAVGLAHAH